MSAANTIVTAALTALCAGAFVVDALLMRTMIIRFHMNDFGKFYYSARAYLDGGDMYAPSPATDLRFVQAPDLQYLNMNPPHFHLLILPVAPLEPATAVLLWMSASLFALVGAVMLISHEIRMVWNARRVALAVFGILAFAGTQAFFVTGQLSMLLLLAMTICWLDARRGRWTSAAVWLGACLSVKPFLLIFAPYLAVTRRFRALGVVLATAAACFLIGTAVFGADAYAAWYRALGQSGDWTWASMNASVLGLFRRSFDANPSVVPLTVAPRVVRLWIPVAGTIGIVTFVAALRDRTESATDRAFALLLVAAQLISPLGWIYYVTIAAGPAAAVAVRSHEPRLRSRTTVLAAVAGVGFVWPLPLLSAFQPHGWATLVVASIYFWATLAAWMWLLVRRVASTTPANNSSSPHV